LIAKVPHGHWKTTTFLAALRNDRIDAIQVDAGHRAAKTRRSTAGAAEVTRV
jgi:hypothetical protein